MEYDLTMRAVSLSIRWSFFTYTRKKIWCAGWLNSVEKDVAFWNQRVSRYRATLSPESVCRRTVRDESSVFFAWDNVRVSLSPEIESVALPSLMWHRIRRFGVPGLWIFFRVGKVVTRSMSLPKTILLLSSLVIVTIPLAHNSLAESPFNFYIVFCSSRYYVCQSTPNGWLSRRRWHLSPRSSLTYLFIGLNKISWVDRCILFRTRLPDRPRVIEIFFTCPLLLIYVLPTINTVTPPRSGMDTWTFLKVVWQLWMKFWQNCYFFKTFKSSISLQNLISSKLRHT